MANINYSGGDQTVTGSQNADSIFATPIFNPFGGTLIAANGRDTVFGLGGDDVIFSGENNDTLFGGSGNDELRGGDGNDILFGGTGSDSLEGGDDSDVINIETNLTSFGTDTISGGDGFDTIRFNTATVTEHFLGNPTFAVQGAARGVSVNLVNFFVPGIVGDFQLLTDDDGSVSSFLTQTRGRIVDEGGDSAVLADVEQFDLTLFGDFFLDSSASHTINGGGGNDFISGGRGFDVINGGTGTDTALYGSATSAVSVSLLDFGSGGSATDGLGTSDTLISIENVHGSSFNDFVLGDGTSNTILGFAGNDTILAGSGTDTVRGGDGNDFLRGGSGNDTVDGGAGTDTAEFLDWNGFTSGFLSTVRGAITLGEGTASSTAVLTRTAFLGTFVNITTLEADTLTGIENVNGSDHSDTITGNSLANILNGDGGNDTIDGGRGSDTLNGGDGVDTAKFISGNGFLFTTVNASLATGQATVARSVFTINGLVTTTDTDTLSGFENLTSGSGNDRLTGNSVGNILDGGAGSDTLAGLGGGDILIGGEGIDTADYSASGAPVIVNLGLGTASGGDAQGDTFQSIENLTGSAGKDLLTGSAGINIIKGNGGDDTINGGAGADTLDGGEGFDTADYRGTGAVDIDLAQGIAAGTAAGDTYVSIEAFLGGDGADTMKGDGADNTFNGFGGQNTLIGRGGNDTLTGGAGEDILQGGADDDTLTGNGKADVLEGNGGIDTLSGGAGLDRIDGGIGGDVMTGGGASDTFIFTGGNAGQDQITDFQDGTDVIEFDTNLVGSFSDLGLTGNGTDHVLITYGGESIELFGVNPITLTAADFNIL